MQIQRKIKSKKPKSKKPKPRWSKKPNITVEQKAHLAQYPKSLNLPLEVPDDGSTHPDSPLVTEMQLVLIRLSLAPALHKMTLDFLEFAILFSTGAVLNPKPSEVISEVSEP